MAGKCNKDNCYPEETGCNFEGCDILSQCPNYNIGDEKSDQDSTENLTDDFFIRMPWTGNTLGLKDLEYLTMVRKATMIGISGVASAGKTTFLATLYCLLRQGFKIGDYSFSGSLTLYGWENIAWYLSWKQNNLIQFPPHTTSNSGRIPGMLHLCVINSQGNKKDLIFTDAPGEWFDHWSFNEKDPNAQGAIWIHNSADAFLLFADCDMLAGPELGKARKQTRMVADRLKQNLLNRPLGLIWSKSDVNLDPQIKEQISSYIQNSVILNYKEFETSVREGNSGALQQNVCESIAWILESIEKEQNVLPKIIAKTTDDLFLSKR